MNTPPTTPSLAPELARLLRALRLRIRAYVWTQGLALLVVAAVALFWVLLTIDWVFEPTIGVRQGMLLAAGGVLALVALRWLVLPATRRLQDRSLAVLVERRFGGFNNSLITSVEMAGRYQGDDEYGKEMFAHTMREATARVEGLSLGRVLHSAPLTVALALCGALLISIALFAAVASGSLLFGLQRLALLSDEPWPRDTRLVIRGFEDGQAVVAKGADLEVLVEADTAKRLPESVEIRFRADDGTRGRVYMVREGQAAGEQAWQPYRHVFQGVLAPLSFEVRGGDARLRNLHVRVVENPAIEMTLYCIFPKYTRRAPRELPVAGAVPLPRGTEVVVRAQSNKDLRRVYVDYADAEGKPLTHAIDLLASGGPSRQFEYALGRLDADTVLSFTLHDTDGVQSRDPTRLVLSVVEDEPPQVAVRLDGIGTAITPQARVPLVGRISDDYGVSRAAIQYVVDEGEPELLPLREPANDRTALEVAEVLEVEPLALQPGQKLLVGTTARDNRHLPESAEPEARAPQDVVGERFLLDVVTPAQLRSMLESRELNLRQRYETIMAEVVATRESLTGLTEAAAADDVPGDDDAGTVADEKAAGVAEAVEAETAPAANVEPAEDVLNRQSRQRLTLARAVQNSQKNGEETLSVATSFDDIRAELVNNRVDTEELRIRLGDYIARPLHHIAEDMFPELEARLHTLESTLLVDQVDAQAAGSAQQAALAQADAILVAMEEVRGKMLELETFNEALDLLRGIIAAQEKVSERTSKLRSEKLRSLLE